MSPRPCPASCATSGRLGLTEFSTERFPPTRHPQQDEQWLATSLDHRSAPSGMTVTVGEHSQLIVA